MERILFSAYYRARNVLMESNCDGEDVCSDRIE